MDKELRRLILIGLGAVLAIIVGRAVISSVYDDRLAAARVVRERNKLRGTGEAGSAPARAERARVADLRTELEGELERLVDDLAYALPPAFDVPAGQSPDLAYLQILRREQDELVKRAAFFGKSVPSNLGMPELNPTGLEDVLRTLRALHVVHRVVGAALEADVDRVAEITPAPVARRARTEGGFVRAHRVDFELHGSQRALRDTLAGVLAGQPYLALEDVRIEATDEDGRRLRCRFAALALVIDREHSALQP